MVLALAYLLTLAHRYLAAAILTRFTVRIHSGIVEKGRSWAKLWYLLRALDINGSGFCQIEMSTIRELLTIRNSTIRQWLREGIRVGAFRHWRVNGESLRVALSSLHKLCLALGQGELGFGVVTEIPLTCLHRWRSFATAAVAQREQQLSRFAAWRSLPSRARKHYKLPHPDALLNCQPRRLSDVSATGSIRCVLHVGKRRVFVSKGFIPFGTSQESIARERSLCDRTVRRHLAALGIERRQICQAKAAYRSIAQAIEWDSPSFAPEPDICLSHGNILTERSGIVGVPHSQRVGRNRFFHYADKDWIYRCNIYEEALPLLTMRRSNRNYRALLKKSRVAR